MVPSANKISLLNFSLFPEADHFYIGYSGGMDSSALLHAIVNNKSFDHSKFTAVHINHNLDQQSDDWERHCKNVCEILNINFISKSVNPISNSEDACRKERQKTYNNLLKKGDCLITAHHQNDQIETVLFRLLRGTGLQGLIGMSTLNSQGKYDVYRPLLKIPKTEIKKYINENNIEFVNDPSNNNNHYSRNYLRNEIIPLLTAKFPNTIESIQLSSSNLSDSALLLNHLIGKTNPFCISKFKYTELLTTAFYHWLGQFEIEMCSHKALTQFATDCLNASHDKVPTLSMLNWQLKYWQNHVYLLKKFDISPLESKTLTLVSNQESLISKFHGSLIINSKQTLSLDVTIKFEKNSEKIKLNNHKQRSKVKNIFQNNGITPWIRKIIPFLYIDNELMAIGDQFLSDKYESFLSTHNAEYKWISPQLLL